MRNAFAMMGTLLLAGTAFAQPAYSNVPVGLLSWDVVSIKSMQGKDCKQTAGMRTTADGVQVVCVPLLLAIERAYGMTDPTRIIAAPDWVQTFGMYEIDAKVAAADITAFSKLGRNQQLRMLQPVLADRFHMKAHMEKREMPAYDLVVAKGGPKLKPPTADDANKAGQVSRERGKIQAADSTLESLPWILTEELGRPVVDRTGLQGRYDYTLQYAPVAPSASDEAGGSSVFTALEEQLGLKLEAAKEPMDVLVIDSIEQPTAN